MTTPRAMSLKARIRNYAKNNHIAAQVVLQNYMFERFLARLAVSEYRERFVIKGGMLIASMVGLDTRSTMDLDTTLRGIPLTEESIVNAFHAISGIDLDDDARFTVVSIHPIRKDDRYGGYCVRMNAIYDTIVTPLSVDVSTGDIVTPEPIPYDFTGIFDDTVRISLLAYNIETVLAEKAETILSRGEYNTRPRDYYDVYILTTTHGYDRRLFEEALAATSEHRGTTEIIADREKMLNTIASSEPLKALWRKYQQQFPYARAITYDDTMTALRALVGTSNETESTATT